ncbi:MAG: hypothetical protein A3H32_07800 [Betaproteobacteria bacterium RIFCSPLOWO2_02_FULL_63_19]|nr:MAG: hypothetical protein A3H32_07800 [Betaproteobacteria bacterium RIFCSPLOWO2_02_FULL_63_19]
MGSIHLFRDLPELKHFAAGEYIFRKGDPGSAMYMIIEGEVELVIGKSVIEVAHPGAFIGEMSLIDDAVRSASARAKSAARVFPIDLKRFQELIKTTPSFALDVMKALTLRLRRNEDRTTERRTVPTRGRVAATMRRKRSTRRTR